MTIGYRGRVSVIRLGDLVRRRREDLGLSRATLASHISASQWTSTTVSNERRFRLVYEEIRKIEDGELHAPGIVLLVSMLLELGLDVGVLADLVESPDVGEGRLQVRWKKPVHILEEEVRRDSVTRHDGKKVVATREIVS